MNELTQARLKSVVDYDPQTGVFTWRKTPKGPACGRKAGAINSDGYIQIKIDQRIYKAHRLVWLYVHGRWPDDLLDHINLVRADNRLCNLREATKSQNRMNVPALRHNRSGIKGVFPKDGKWIARIGVDGKSIELGRFDSAEQASSAYAEASKIYHGDYAYGAAKEIA